MSVAERKPGPNGVPGKIIGEIPLGDGVQRIQIRRGDCAIIGSHGPIFVATETITRMAMRQYS